MYGAFPPPEVDIVVEQVADTDRIVEDQDVMGGAARFKETRVRVSDVVVAHEYREWSPRKIADEYGVSISDVYAALDYYHRDTARIRREIQEREQTVKQMMEASA